MNEVPDEQLMLRYQQGDRSAFAAMKPKCGESAVRKHSGPSGLVDDDVTRDALERDGTDSPEPDVVT